MDAWLIFLLIPYHVNTVTIGSIPNVTFTVVNPPFSKIMTGTKQDCLCAMVSSTNISAFNYFSNNTCQLFSNASIMNVDYSWTPNIGGLFYFLYLPVSATTASSSSTGPSSVSSQHKLTTAELSTRNIRTSTDPPTTVAATTTFAHMTTTAISLPSTVAGTLNMVGSSMSQLSTPNDVFVTPNGTFYVADYYNNRVQIFNPGNTTAISSQNGIWSPLTLYVDNASNYYVVESVSPVNRISKWPSNRTILTLFNAYGMAMDSFGNLYLSTLNNTIVFWNASSNSTTIIVPSSKGLSGPRHIFLDEANQALYIADSLMNRIVKFLISVGNLTFIAANQLNFPAGVCVSKRDGAIYVADANNNRIQKWAVNATVGITILGNANGTASSGTFGLNGPYAVALDATETFLYVADSNNNRIQRLPLN